MIMPVKPMVVAILLGSVLAALPALAQEPSAFPTKLSFDASLSSPKFVPNPAEGSPMDSEAFREHEFIQRLSSLSIALNDFIAAYKGGQIDLKKVKALRKAMQEMEKSDWFRPQKAK